MNQTLELYRQYQAETGDPIAASNLVLAHAMLAQHERQQEQAIYRLCEAGELSHHRVGRLIRIPPEAIDKYICRATKEVESEGRKIKSEGSFLQYVKSRGGR